jgi:hypothetical protein
LFDRKPVLAWLKQLLFETVEHPLTSQGGMLWEHPSLGVLRSELIHSKEISLVGRALFSNETTADNDTINWLRTLLIDGVKVSLYVQDALLVEKKRSHQGRMILNKLRSFLEEGQLKIALLPQRVELKHMPRVCGSPLQDGLKVFTDYPVPSLLDQLLPEPVYKLMGNYDGCGTFQEALHGAQLQTVEVIFPPENKMQRMEFASGQTRNFSEIFAPIQNAYVERLIIKDPYCAVASNIQSLCDCIEQIQKQVKSIAQVQVQFQELHYKDHNYQSVDLARKGAQMVIQSRLDLTPKIVVTPFANAKNFHDRIVYLDCIDEDGLEVRHIFDLSGGVDKLMDSSVATLVFYSQQER